MLPGLATIKVVRTPCNRYYFNTKLKVVGYLAKWNGDYLHVKTRRGSRVWPRSEVKEIDYRECIRCMDATIPDNVPRYYIKEWKC